MDGLSDPLNRGGALLADLALTKRLPGKENAYLLEVARAMAAILNSAHVITQHTSDVATYRLTEIHTYGRMHVYAVRADTIHDMRRAVPASSSPMKLAL